MAAEFEGFGDAEGQQDGAHQHAPYEGGSPHHHAGWQHVEEQARTDGHGHCLSRFTLGKGLYVSDHAPETKFNGLDGRFMVHANRVGRPPVYHYGV
ncbi:MAG: hypothetical protein JWR15_433 [Prosthecobacter sp.]|nr:hypothetical protein [Prosthecobacter sp.]